MFYIPEYFKLFQSKCSCVFVDDWKTINRYKYSDAKKTSYGSERNFWSVSFFFPDLSSEKLLSFVIDVLGKSSFHCWSTHNHCLMLKTFCKRNIRRKLSKNYVLNWNVLIIKRKSVFNEKCGFEIVFGFV